MVAEVFFYSFFPHGLKKKVILEFFWLLHSVTATEQSELSISECHVITLINDLLGHSKSVFKGL